MIIAARYSFNGGAEAIAERYPHLLREVEAAIRNINADVHRTKRSTEITMMGKMLYSPVSLNKAFKKQLQPLGWRTQRVSCEYSTEHYTDEHKGMSVERRERFPARLVLGPGLELPAHTSRSSCSVWAAISARTPTTMSRKPSRSRLSPPCLEKASQPSLYLIGVCPQSPTDGVTVI